MKIRRDLVNVSPVGIGTGILSDMIQAAWHDTDSSPSRITVTDGICRLVACVKV